MVTVRNAESKLNRLAAESPNDSAQTSAVCCGGIPIPSKSTGKRCIRSSAFIAVGISPLTVTRSAAIVLTHVIALTVLEIILLTAGRQYEQG